MVAGKVVKKLEAEIVRGAILKDGTRIDGRTHRPGPPDRERWSHFLPRTHGSALFTRGETQAICTTTLGTKDSEQMIDGLEGLSYSNFMLHYNFPPYSVGEVGRFGAPSRRDTGHGKLAWRALRAVLPSKEEFPYTIRVVSDITESNGSSSMATVCGGSLAMMDAGVPITRPVSGIAMGLILEGDEFTVLSPTSSATRITWATWTSRSPARPKASPRCRWTSRSPGSPARSSRRRSTRRRPAARTSWAK